MSQHITSVDTYRLLGRSGLRASPLAFASWRPNVRAFAAEALIARRHRNALCQRHDYLK